MVNYKLCAFADEADAALSGQIPNAVKRERSAALIALGQELHQARLTRALRTPLRHVLFETYENGLAIGHTDTFLEVAIPAPAPLHSCLLPVRLQTVAGERLLAEPVEEVH